jgi:putative methanogenesis marker protein 3
MEIHLDGKRVEVSEGTRLGDVLIGRDPRCSIAVIRPAFEEAAESQQIRIVTSVGDLVIEVTDPSVAARLSEPDLAERLHLHWADRYAAAFGPFESSIRPAREPSRYERGDVVLGCGGYDPLRSYLIFSRIRHTADYGTPAGGGVIGRVVTGRGLIDRLGEGDRILSLERVLERGDRFHAVVTTDSDFALADGMKLVTYVEVAVQGYEPGRIDTGAARSTEHFLLAMQEGHFRVGRSTSTHIRDEHLVPTRVPAELTGPRKEGIVTVRTAGKASGAVYIYTQDVSASPAHTVVGRVTHGIELVRAAGENVSLCLRVEPERFDLIGLPLAKARAVAEERGIMLTADEIEGDRVVVGQAPSTTMEVLAAGAVEIATQPLGEVVDIALDEAHAPLTVTIFREVTGLKHHSVGMMPVVFMFEDVILFKPKIAKGVGIIPENTPAAEVPPYTLAMTNDSRRGSGMVGVRTAVSAEFGPTAEPLSGTNIIGTIRDPEKLKVLKEGKPVYIREVK